MHCMYVLCWIFSRKMKKYKSLPVTDSTAVYNELIDNHVATAPQPCKPHVFKIGLCLLQTV